MDGEMDTERDLNASQKITMHFRNRSHPVSTSKVRSATTSSLKVTGTEPPMKRFKPQDASDVGVHNELNDK